MNSLLFRLHEHLSDHEYEAFHGNLLNELSNIASIHVKSISSQISLIYSDVSLSANLEDVIKNNDSKIKFLQRIRELQSKLQEILRNLAPEWDQKGELSIVKESIKNNEKRIAFLLKECKQRIKWLESQSF